MAIAIAFEKKSPLQKIQKKVSAIHGLAIPFFVPYLNKTAHRIYVRRATSSATAATLEDSR
jgi:hypothetical protein